MSTITHTRQLLLTSTSDIVRLITSAAVSTMEVHTSYMDVNGTTITPGRTNTRITTATTTTIVGSPAASTQRNVKAIYCTNNSSGTSCTVSVEGSRPRSPIRRARSTPTR
jgi:hypothetical protein